MVPLTNASACPSPAGLSPSRFWTAVRTAWVTSWVRAGSGVRFSNGSTATVRTPGGRPPPLNLYMEPPSRIALALSRSRTHPRIRTKRFRFRVLVKRQIEPGRGARSPQPRAQGKAVGAEAGLHPADALAGAAYLGDQPLHRAALPHVLHSISSGDELPSGDVRVRKGPHPAARLGRPRDPQHRPEERIVGDQLLDVLFGLGPDRRIPGDECRRPSAARRAGDVEPDRVGPREPQPAASGGRTPLVLELPAKAEVAVVSGASGGGPALRLTHRRGDESRRHRHRRQAAGARPREQERGG